MDVLEINVPRHAVKDGELAAGFLDRVKKVEKITKEQYLENMYD